MHIWIVVICSLLLYRVRYAFQMFTFVHCGIVFLVMRKVFDMVHISFME